MTGLAMPVLIGAVGLGTELGLWAQKHQSLQSAADSAAVSAAMAYNSGGSGNVAEQAAAVAASYGFVHGVNGVSVKLNMPPQSGSYASKPGALEVVVQQQQQRLFSQIWDSQPVMVTGRAVAVATGNATGCVLATDPSARGAATVQGSSRVTLNECSLYVNSGDAGALTVGGAGRVTALSVGVVGGVSGAENITAMQGIQTGQAAASDPYAHVSFPPFSGCTETGFKAKTAVTISPGVYCHGMTINAGADVTFSPGIYYLDRGTFAVHGGASIYGSGVTLVFTSSTNSHWATATINGNASVNMKAPTSGPLAGIAIFGDRRIPANTSFRFEGGASQVLGGAIYVPTGAISYAGGANTNSGCIQIVGRTITFTGNSNLTIDCGSSGTKPLGSVLASLVE